MAGSTPKLGLPYVEAADAIVDFPAVSAELADDIEDLLAGDQLLVASAAVTGTTTVTGTAVADVIACSAFTVPAGGGTYEVEFFCPNVTIGASGTHTMRLQDGSTVLGIVAVPLADSKLVAPFWRVRVVLAAGSRTIKLTGQNGASQTTSYFPGAGSGDVRMPMTLRVRRVL